MSELEILDPTAGESAPRWALAARHRGRARIACLDISKPQGDVFLDALEGLLVAQGHAVSRQRKPTMARPATRELIREMAAQADVAVVALAD